jgi:hypothetical protein
VSQCYYGGFSSNGLAWTGAIFDLRIRNNSFSAGTAVVPPVMGYQAQNGNYTVEVVGNTVTGTAGFAAGIVVMGGSSVQSVRSARVDSNTVASGAGFGLKLWSIDTLDASGNAVTGIDTLPWSGEAGISLRDVWVAASVVNNTVTGGHAPGIRVEGAASGVALDTNLIADNTGAGILLKSFATGRLNSVRRNGTGILDSVGTGSVFRSNNIEGNGFGVMNLGFTSLSADSSWWGDPLGPQCASCNPSSAGDSVSVNVSFAGWAADTITGAPAGSAPATAAGMTTVRTGTGDALAAAGPFEIKPDGVVVLPQGSEGGAGGGAVGAGERVVAAARPEKPAASAPEFKRPTRSGGRR